MFHELFINLLLVSDIYISMTCQYFIWSICNYLCIFCSTSKCSQVNEYIKRFCDFEDLYVLLQDIKEAQKGWYEIERNNTISWFFGSKMSGNPELLWHLFPLNNSLCILIHWKKSFQVNLKEGKMVQNPLYH